MNILDVIVQYLESRGYVLGPAFNPGCFFFAGSGGSKNKIVFLASNGKSIVILRSKEPTVVIVYRGWADDQVSSLIDLSHPNSLDDLGELLDG